MNKKITVRGLLVAALFLITHAALAVTPEDGWWWNPSEAGRGFNIETQNGTVFVATFIYDGAGQPVWFSGSGTLSGNGTLNATLMRSDGGQCVGCPFQAPSTTPQADITIQFHSASNATVNWQGTTIEIERFNFALGGVNEKLFGGWLFVTGSPTSALYFGDRMLFSGTTTNDEGTIFTTGHRTGNANRPAFISVSDELKLYGFDFLGLLISSNNHQRWFGFRFVGLNRIEGRETTANQSDPIEESAERLISGGGLPFIATRNPQAQSPSANPMAKESVPAGLGIDFDQSKIDDILSSLEVASPGVSNKSAGQNSEEITPLIELMNRMLHDVEIRAR